MKQSLEYALNKLAKWRSVFAGWQLGTRPDTDPECRAVRDHREVTLLLRAEMSALVVLLAEKGVIRTLEWENALEAEARKLDADLERRFPGFRTTLAGLEIDVEKAQEMCRGWRP